MSTAAAVRPISSSTFDLSGLRVALLMGGRSGERDVSLWTGRGVGEALRGMLDPLRGPRLPREVQPIEIAEDGAWLVGAQRCTASEALERLAHIDVFFLCLHGGQGEDGTLQGFLETAGRRHTGSGVRASAVCMDKQATRALAQASRMRVAPAVCLSAAQWRCARAERLAEVAGLGCDGWVIKPRCGGSSVSTFMTADTAELARSIESVLATGDDALVEARVAGVELSCGVLGNRGTELVALPPVEIRPKGGEFFDYAQKYSADGALELCPAQGVGAASLERVRELAMHIHAAAGCDGYSRTDFIVPREGECEGEPVLLEVNTLPGLTERSLLPQEAAVVGVDYTTLCLWILDLALKRGATP